MTGVLLPASDNLNFRSRSSCSLSFLFSLLLVSLVSPYKTIETCSPTTLSPRYSSPSPNNFPPVPRVGRSEAHTRSPSLQLNDKSLLKNASFINGEWVSGSSTFDVHGMSSYTLAHNQPCRAAKLTATRVHFSTDPATGALLGSVPDHGVAEVKLAVEAAAEALKSWRKTTAKVRPLSKSARGGAGVLEVQLC